VFDSMGVIVTPALLERTTMSHVNTLIVGAGGQLGHAFANRLPTAIRLGRSALDITNALQVEKVVDRESPGVLINCAAYTDVDAAESDETTARTVNAVGPRILADVCRRAGVLLVSFSTDHVFAGNEDKTYTESDATGPVNIYGATKLAGERAILETTEDALIVRTAWLMSPTHACFARWVVETAFKGPMRVVDDQYGSPSWATDVAAKTAELIERRARGIVHVVNSESMTKFDAARYLAIAADLPETRVSRAKSADFPRPAARPKSAPLRSERLSEFGVAPLGPWSSNVDAVAREIMRGRHMRKEQP